MKNNSSVFYNLYSDDFRMNVLKCKTLLKSFISQGLNPKLLEGYFGSEIYNQAKEEVLLWDLK